MLGVLLPQLPWEPVCVCVRARVPCGVRVGVVSQVRPCLCPPPPPGRREPSREPAVQPVGWRGRGGRTKGLLMGSRAGGGAAASKDSLFSQRKTRDLVAEEMSHLHSGVRGVGENPGAWGPRPCPGDRHPRQRAPSRGLHPPWLGFLPGSTSEPLTAGVLPCAILEVHLSLAPARREWAGPVGPRVCCSCGLGCGGSSCHAPWSCVWPVGKFGDDWAPAALRGLLAP